MLKVGITGGIGSGKSTVSELFQLLGVPVYNADDNAKRLMNESPLIREKLLELFGPKSYTDQVLNRKFISQQVFNNAGRLAQLNAIVHPVVIRDGNDWLNSRTEPIVMKEAAIFFETGSGAGLDYIIGVYAPQALRIQRTMNRDGVSREDVLQRMSKQIDEELKMKLCDFVLLNDEIHMLIPQVIDLHKQLMEIARHKEVATAGT
jgi:dephospho-CoA kinase